jgi:hypothetical protein
MLGGLLGADHARVLGGIFGVDKAGHGLPFQTLPRKLPGAMNTRVTLIFIKFRLVMYIIHETYECTNFRTLDLNLLRVFDQVMSERNLTRAAHNLAMTQPAVSNALRRLRETLGDELVRRSGYGVEPTPRALALWPPLAMRLRQLEASLAPGDFVAAEAQHLYSGHGRCHSGRADARAGGDH